MNANKTTGKEMKRQLRVSGLKDYVAVDLVNDKGVIISTPFYLKYTGTQKIKYKDDGASRLTDVFMSPDGDRLLCRDSEGFDFACEFTELLESHIQF